jgi:hypothetical protein
MWFRAHPLLVVFGLTVIVFIVMMVLAGCHSDRLQSQCERVNVGKDCRM